MVWTAPMTAAASNTMTASQYNTHVRDNFLELGVAKLSGVNGTMVVAGTNNITPRYVNGSEIISTDQSTTSATYTDLATVGPIVTATTGTNALVIWAASIYNSLSDVSSTCSYEISGATTRLADTSLELSRDGMSTSGRMRAGMMHFRTDLVAGSNTFKMKYKVASGTGSFQYRQIIVIPF